MTGKRIVIIGTGGMGREALWIARRCNEAGGGSQIAGFVTNVTEQHGTSVCGMPVLGAPEWLVGKGDCEAVCAIGDPRARRRLTMALAADGVRFASLVDPSVLMSSFVEVGTGCIICPGAVLTTQVTVSDHVIVNLSSTVSHDVSIGPYATLAPGVRLAGWVVVEEAADLGVAAAVIPKKRIGKGAIVGAGAVVVSDVASNTVVAGVPAKLLRTLADDVHL